MDFLIIFIATAIIYSVLYFFDLIFKTCSHYPYIQFLNYTGFDVGFFRVTWFTTTFNRSFHRWGSFRPKILLQWYSAGVMVYILLLPLSFYFLIQSIFTLVVPASYEITKAEPLVVPVVPGINLPLSDVGFYVVTLGVASIFHEVGHLAAARREDVTVAGVGFTILFILPAAFVKFGTNQINALAPKRQLRILCAGIWHNVVLAVMAYIMLLLTPLLMHPIYDIGRGVVVMDIAKNSPAAGPTGIQPGDIFSAINDCEVSDVESWRQCLIQATHLPPPGYCINEDLVHQLDESIPVKHIEGRTVECCSRENDDHLCFEALEDETPLQILQYSCLPGRTVVAGTSYSCLLPRDCPAGLHCVRPVLANSTTLLRIQRSKKPVVIFVGKSRQVLESVQVSGFIPSFKYISPELAEMLLKLCKYFVLFSSGFAIVNSVPCFYSDGNHIITAFLKYVGSTKIRRQKIIVLIINIFGSLLLGINFFAIIFKALRV